MINVLYIGDSASTLSETEKEQYLDKCLEKYPQFHLLDNEKCFIKNLLILISYYINCVLLEEESSSFTFVTLLNFCVPNNINTSSFIHLVEYAIKNEDGSLSEKEKSRLEKYLSSIKDEYSKEKVLLMLQVIQLDCALNPECSQVVYNIVNTAVIRCCTGNDKIADEIYSQVRESSYKPVYLEFSNHYEELLKHSTKIDDSLIEYAYQKYDKLPLHIRNKIERFNFQICLSYQLECDKKEYRKLGSTHFCGDDIRVWLNADKIFIDISIYHELGHVIDYVYKNHQGIHSENNGAWTIIYQMDKQKFFDGKVKDNKEYKELYEYGISNETEYFACAFAEYIENPEKLRELVPDTYYYLEAMLSY